MNTSIAHLDRAVALFDSAADLARACGVTPQAVSAARSAGRVGPKLAARIEAATGKRVRAEDLCPDLVVPDPVLPRPRVPADAA